MGISKMINYRQFTFETQRLDELLFDIRKALGELELQFYQHEIKIAMPEYMNEVFFRYDLHQYITAEKRTELFGCEIVPHYENMIVVFHPDMPLKTDNAYQIIDIRDYYKKD